MTTLRNRSGSVVFTVFVFLISILTIELISGIIISSMFKHGNSFVDAKNPLFRRGWVEYTEPMDDMNDYLIILITNSQGAHPNDKNIIYYGEYLENLLNENSDQEYRVLNWAMPGARAAEYVIMLTRLIDYEPGLVIISTSGENFVVHQDNPIQTYNNDIIRLANRLPYRNYLTDSFLRRHSLYDPLWMLLHNTNLGRLHQFIYDGADWTRNQRDQREGRIDEAVNINWYRRQEWTEQSFQYIEEIFEVFHQVVDDDTPFLIGAMPFNYDGYKNSRLDVNEELINVLADYKPNKRNIFLFDALKAVDTNLFTDADHFVADGHIAYATYLYDLIHSLPILENAEDNA